MLSDQQIQLYRRSPGAFIEAECRTEDGSAMKLEQWQRQVLSDLYDEHGVPRHRVAVVSLPKDSGKSYWAAALTCWHSYFGCEIPAPDAAFFASDAQQAALCHRMLSTIIESNEALLQETTLERQRIVVDATGARVTVESHDESGSHGQAYSLCICDECGNWFGRGLLDSLLGQVHKRRYRDRSLLLVISTVGGFQHWFNTWLDELQKAGEASGVYVYRREGAPVVSWVSEATLAQARAVMPPRTFQRLWLNVVPDSLENAAFTSEQIDACFTMSGPPSPQDVLKSGLVLDLGVDLGRKSDLACIAAVLREGCRFRLAYLRYWRPTPTQPIQPAAVGQALWQLIRQYPVRKIGIDPWGAGSIMDMLRGRAEEFVFSARTKHEISVALYQSISGECLAMWRDAELQKQLQTLVLRDGSQGFVLEHAAGQHDDLPVAIGIALAVSQRAGNWVPISQRGV